MAILVLESYTIFLFDYNPWLIVTSLDHFSIQLRLQSMASLGHFSIQLLSFNLWSLCSASMRHYAHAAFDL